LNVKDVDGAAVEVGDLVVYARVRDYSPVLARMVITKVRPKLQGRNPKGNLVNLTAAPFMLVAKAGTFIDNFKKSI
jgi:hypothetical protein